MVLFFEPIFLPKIWGGQKLATLSPKSLTEPIGECWGISIHQEGMSKVQSGPHQGETLAGLWHDHPDWFGNPPWKTFPIQVKLIDAFDDLSIQVHPKGILPGEDMISQCECWIIIDRDPGTEVIIGHHAKTKAEFIDHTERMDYHHLIQRIPIEVGDFFFIEAGTLHAICKGTLLLEIKQSTDISYRFYDYERVEKGKKRPLQLRKAIANVTIPDEEIHREIIDAAFQVQVLEVHQPITIPNRHHGTFFVVIEGNLTIHNESASFGAFGFVTASDEDIVLEGNGKLVLIHLVS
ncbi:MAG: type I phosphomannose isomerase catalytic subunit [Candidatus Izemoplasmatales bacterium]